MELPSGDIIRSLTYGETYKYFGVMENRNINHGLVREKVASEYKRRQWPVHILLEPWTDKLENCYSVSGITP